MMWRRLKRMTNDYEYNVIDDFIKCYSDEKISHSDFLEHHGTKGQKWGRRQYQNSDGSLTALGRIHYGVGEARKGAKKVAEGTKAVTGKLGGAAASGAKKLGGAVRKTVVPTNADLAEKYQKAVDANNRKQLIAATKELQGKKKKLKDMTDQEVMDRFNRLQKEAAIRAMEKEAKKGPVRKFIEENAKAGFNRAMNATVEQAVKNLFAEEKEKSYSDILKERKAQLQLTVMEGDDKAKAEAKQKLADLNSTSGKNGGKNNGGNDNSSSENKNNDKNETVEKKEKKEKKKKNKDDKEIGNIDDIINTNIHRY